MSAKGGRKAGARTAGSRKADRQRTTQVRTAIGFGVFIALIVGAAVLSNALRPDDEPRPSATPTGAGSNTCTGPTPPAPFRDPGPFSAPPQDTTDADSIYVATISTYCGDLKFKIDPLDAPEASRSFIFLARKKFYDGLRFDRVEPGLGLFAGTGNAGYTLAVRSHGRAVAARELVMLDVTPGPGTSVASPFAISDGGKIEAVRMGSAPDEDARRANDDTLERFFALRRAGPAQLPPLYIVHVKVEQFSRG